MKKLTLMIDAANDIDFNAILAAVGSATVTIIVDGGAPPDTIDIGDPVVPVPAPVSARKTRKSRLPPEGTALPPGAIVRAKRKGRPKTDDARIVTKPSSTTGKDILDVPATAAAMGISMADLMGTMWPKGSLEQRLRMSHSMQQRRGRPDTSHITTEGEGDTESKAEETTSP